MKYKSGILNKIKASQKTLVTECPFGVICTKQFVNLRFKKIYKCQISRSYPLAYHVTLIYCLLRTN